MYPLFALFFQHDMIVQPSFYLVADLQGEMRVIAMILFARLFCFWLVGFLRVCLRLPPCMFSRYQPTLARQTSAVFPARARTPVKEFIFLRSSSTRCSCQCWAVGWRCWWATRCRDCSGVSFPCCMHIFYFGAFPGAKASDAIAFYRGARLSVPCVSPRNGWIFWRNA